MSGTTETSTLPPQVKETNSTQSLADLWSQLLAILQKTRNIHSPALTNTSPTPSSSLPAILSSLAAQLTTLAHHAEAEALLHVHEKAIDSPNFGGLGLSSTTNTALSQGDVEEVLFLVEAWLESLNSNERTSLTSSETIEASQRSAKTRPMTLAQKIFAQHCVGGCKEEGLRLGDVVRVGIDWVLASELSWQAMERTYAEMGRPGVWRNDRFWLAGDHVVHPDVANVPKVKAMVDVAERAKKEFRMTEYQGMNFTIMHTEFVRERAEPGMLVVGSDSHTCSAGAVGCLAIGLGTADVMMTLSLGETWFKIPESVKIEFVGKPAFGMSGKDVILHILKELKRNTVAADRIVEFVGEGARHLSCDARFAISNMCTEFGAITGVFEPDAVTKDYVSRRRRKANKQGSTYFRADTDAEYASHHIIDLSKVEATIAVYPEPDNVVPVSEMGGTALDGVFIGACTTTEEELVLAALVLKAGLQRGLPLAKGKRHYVPGSLPIVERLKELGLLEVYEEAGFTRGPPGCSYCVGLSAEKAAEGETWLSSQNRNFENRMGKGAFGHITSAIVCAASSFSMTITDPMPLLEELDVAFFDQYKGTKPKVLGQVDHVEPKVIRTESSKSPDLTFPKRKQPDQVQPSLGQIHSKITVLGDFIDTDALAPGPTLTTCVTDAEFGEHVLEHTHPDFREKVRQGQQVVVAGNAFGVGSSREVAVSALKGAGVKAVIARSFAFIYGRNQPSLGLLGFTITDDEFYKVAEEGVEIDIDVPQRIVKVQGKQFTFALSQIEYQLTTNKGISESFKKYGKRIWEEMTAASEPVKQVTDRGSEAADTRLNW